MNMLTTMTIKHSYINVCFSFYLLYNNAKQSNKCLSGYMRFSIWGGGQHYFSLIFFRELARWGGYSERFFHII